MALGVGTRFGAYEIVGELGTGGMGEVYRAKDLALEREVAIKVLPESVVADANRVARFEQEAKTLAALNHPNIAHIYGLERSGETTALVMELVEGPTLADRIAEGPIPPEEALNIAMQIADALEAAHGRQIVHRDLKPANVKVRPDGTVKVLDFGIAKALETQRGISGAQTPSLTTPAMTQAGILLGTAAYMAPEQARGKAVDQRADIWAFGCLLYEMLTGQPAFGGEDVPTTLARVLANATELDSIPAMVSPDVRKSIELCLEKDLKKRIADIRDVKLALQGAFETGPRGMLAGEAVIRPLWKRALPIAATAVVVGLLAAALTVWAVVRPGVPALARFAQAAVGSSPTSSSINRFALTITEHQPAANSRWPVFALSPAGSRFAYQADDGIYVRDFDTLETRRVEGSQNAFANTFFSPDGRFLAYWSNRGDLVRLAVEGGVPTVITTGVVGITGASWAADGTIFYSDDGGTIKRVSADGGDVEVVVPAEDGIWHGSPVLLPNGDSLLFSLAPRGNWDDGETVIQSLATGERRTLLKNGIDAHYVEPGYLVYAIGDSLFGVRFDPNTLQVSGDPRELVSGVHRSLALSGVNYGIARDGTLAYLSRQTQQNRALVWVDRNGTEQDIAIMPSNYWYAQLSPDDSKVALNGWEGGERHVWVADLARGTRQRLTFGTERSSGPAVWLPDGRVAFPYGPNALLQRADGAGTPTVLATDQGLQVSDVSPDGSALLAMNASPPRSTWAFSIKETATDRVPLLDSSSFSEYNATISPDGHWLAYQSDETGRLEVFVRRYPDVDAGGKWQVSTRGGLVPVWSRTAEPLELFFLEPNSDEPAVYTLMSAPVHSESHESFVYDLPVPLFERQFFAYFSTFYAPYDVSLDGSRFLTIKGAPLETAASGTSEVVIVQNWVQELRQRLGE